MRILSHYFVARFLGLFATALLATLILLATVELVLNLDDVSAISESETATGSSPGVLHYLWLRIASYYLPDVLPIASFAAAFIAVAWAGRAMELVAIQAGGIRLGRVVIPILGAALILSLASVILHETLILRADQIWSQRVSGGSGHIDFGRQAFWYHKGRTITNITEADAASRTLFGVEIFERGDNGTITRVVRAERVRIDEDGLWQIEDARIWTFDPEHPTDPPLLAEEADIALDLDALRGDALLGAEPELLPLPELARYLKVQRDVPPSHHRRLMNQFHERLSQPWLVLLFAFLALPFGLRVDRTGRIVRPALEAAAVLGLFFLLRSAGTTLAQQEIVPLGLAPWLSIAVFAFGTLLALRRSAL